MFSKAKTGMILSAVAAVLSAGSILGSAFAATADTTQTAATKKVVMNGWGFFQKGEHEKPIGKIMFKQDNAELLALLKLDAAQLKEQLKAGKSLAEVATAQGVAKDDVIKLLTSQREKQLEEAVTSGKLTQEQADKVKERLAGEVKHAVENKHDDKDGGKGFGKGFKENAELLSLLKLDADQLKEQLKAGKSLAEVAQAQGVSEEAVIQLLTTRRDKELADAVAKGKLTQEQADKIKASSADRIKKFVESKHDGQERGKGFGFKNNTDLLALLKLDADQLKEQLKAGKSLAEVAQVQGVSKDAVISLLTSQREKQLDEAVTNGRLTKEQADKAKARLAEGIKKFVEKKFEGKREHKKDNQTNEQE